MTGSAALIALLFAASLGLGSGITRVQETAPAPTAPQTPAAQAPAHPESGPELFVSSGCSHCHMIDGQGGVKGPNLSGIGRRWKNDAIRTRIEQGALSMPPYNDVLTDAQIATLVDYLHTRRTREPKPKSQPAPPVPAAPATASDPS